MVELRYPSQRKTLNTICEKREKEEVLKIWLGKKMVKEIKVTFTFKLANSYLINAETHTWVSPLSKTQSDRFKDGGNIGPPLLFIL